MEKMATLTFPDGSTYEIVDEYARKLCKDVENIVKITRATLTAGETEVTIENERINENSVFEIYTSIYGVNPSSVSIVTGAITLTFDVQETDMEVGVRIYE